MKNARKIKLDHATNQMVNVFAVVKLASKKISVKSAKKIFGCHPAVSSIQLPNFDLFWAKRNCFFTFFFDQKI